MMDERDPARADSPPDEHIQRAPTLAQQVYESIRDGIIEGKFHPNERLVFDQLATRFGVSQTPIREAMIRLAQEGLVIGDDGRFSVVALTEEYVTDIHLVQSVLEGLAAARAATRLTEADLAELRRLIVLGDELLTKGDAVGYGESTIAFHHTILAAADSLALERELRGLDGHFSYVTAYARRQIGALQIQSQVEHRELLEALAQRDPVRARAIAEQHILNLGRLYFDVVRAARDEEDTPAASSG